MIVTDNQPFTMVSDVSFQSLMAVAEPRYELKTEKYVRIAKIEEIHNQIVR